MNYIQDDELMHYGVGWDENPPGVGSGRYPHGSGENPNQHEEWGLNRYRELKANGLSDTEIARVFDISTTVLRAKRSIDVTAERKEKIAQAMALKETGMSTNAIAKQMGMNESSVRNLLTPELKKRADSTELTAEVLEKQVADKNYIDIGPGAEYALGVTRTKLKTAVALLKEKGYINLNVQVEQLGTGQKTTVSVLAPPGDQKETYKYLVTHLSEIRPVDNYIGEGEEFRPKNNRPDNYIDSSRIMVRYAEEGGKAKDGVIELRRGVEDLSLGKSNYAQVRIAVDGTEGAYYLKGMAMYAADDSVFPKGVDVIVNSNKPLGTPTKENPDGETVFKKMKSDPDNPFGASIKVGGKRGAINIVNEEGDWGEWSKTLASQMLSKQPLPLIKRQLNLTYLDKKEQFDEIKALTNPAVKKKLLESFASECDSSAVDLKSAALPRQASHVILPINSLKENQIYAPNYRPGEEVVLIRYPHAGTFEIPRLIVNNRNKEAAAVIGKNAPDAVGINQAVAGILSGADFDGDTVLVIPVNDKVKVKNSKPFDGLKDFDTGVYALPESAPRMKPKTKQLEMGKITNLITDMTIKGATADELERAVRHSMVVIDAEKHHLDYKQSFKDNGIGELKKKYQSNPDGSTGVSTLISKAKSPIRVDERKKNYRPDPETGEITYTYTGETHDKWTKTADGEWKLVKSGIKNTVESTRMAEAKDAYELSSGTAQENAYADYANKCKAMANEARKLAMSTPPLKYSPEAKQKYAEEVDSLDRQLIMAKKNAPRERQAQLLANEVVRAKVAEKPEIRDDKDKYKKLKNQELTNARLIVGAKKQQINISDKEWEAIQSGAISNNKLLDILSNADLDRVRELATPRTTKELPSSKISLAKTMAKNGYTNGEIAERIGVSASYVSKLIKE